MKQILFLTSNKHKVSEAKTILKPFGVIIVASSAKGDEIQSDSVVVVAKKAAETAYGKMKKPLFVEDSGLFVDSLGGFPGAYSAYINDKLGCEGILRLLDSRVRVRSRPEAQKAPKGLRARTLGQQRQRRARFVCAIAYCDAHGTRVFTGVVRGCISTRIVRGKGFGFDPVFIADGQDKPFSLVPDLKMRLSHRSIALRKLGRFLAKKRRK